MLMMPKEDLSPRILGLVSAEQILSQEDIITNTVRARIRNKIAELLKTNRAEAAEIVLSYLSQFNSQAEEVTEAEVPEMSDELKRALSKNEYILMNTLLENFGDLVKPEDLVEAVYNEEMDTTIPDDENKAAKKLRVIVSATRKKINGWGVIKSKRGRGYCLEITAK